VSAAASFSDNPAEFDQTLALSLDSLRQAEAFFVVALRENDVHCGGASRTSPVRTAGAYYVALPELVALTRDVAVRIPDEFSRARVLADLSRVVVPWR
jgi:hypothetical protein